MLKLSTLWRIAAVLDEELQVLLPPLGGRRG
jgi:hypothetical protein